MKEEYKLDNPVGIPWWKTKKPSINYNTTRFYNPIVLLARL
jgi:hypothetical protein